MVDIKQLVTDRLILRGITENDIPLYEKNFINYEIIRHLSASVPWPYPENGVKEYLREAIFPKQGKDLWMWGLFKKESPDYLIGAVHLWRKGCPEHRGFWLAREHQGKGLMTEAVIPVNDYAFNELGFEKLVFANAIKNKKSGRVKEKTGATQIRIEPAEYVDPEYTEQEVWELTASDWRNYRAML